MQLTTNETLTPGTYPMNTTASHKFITRSTLELQCPDACESIVADLRGLDPSTPVDVYERSVDRTSVAYVWYLGSDLSTTAEEWLAG